MAEIKQRNVIALDVDGDVYLDDAGYIARLYNSAAVAQTVRTRLLLIRQEWFLNLDAGLPWFSKMLGKQANIFLVKSYVSRQILNTDGVVELRRLDISVDKAERTFTINFEYTDEYGKLIFGEL